jgi:hypothetical protein
VSDVEIGAGLFILGAGRLGGTLGGGSVGLHPLRWISKSHT